MNIVKIKEDTAFFGVLITEFCPKESEPVFILQDRYTKLKVSIQGFTKKIAIGTAVYGRGFEDNNEINIDLTQETHRIIGINAKYIQRNKMLDSTDDFSCLAVNDGKPVYGFEDFDELNFKNLRDAFNLFRVVRTELDGEDKHKIGSGIVPKYIFGEALEFYFEEFKVSFEIISPKLVLFQNKNCKRSHWRKKLLKRNMTDSVNVKKVKVFLEFHNFSVH